MTAAAPITSVRAERSMMTVAEAEAALARLSQTHRREIMADALRGGGAYLNAAQLLRTVIVRGRYGDRAGAGFMTWAKRLIDSSVSAALPGDPLQPAHLRSVAGCVSPLLKEPECMFRALPVEPVAMLRRAASVQSSAAVHAVLSRADVSLSNRQFATLERDGQPCLHAPYGLKVRHLAGIAHELGHCLYESEHGWGSPSRAIVSEACALVAGEVAVREFLRDDQVAEADWHDYERRADQLAFLFFAVDHAEVAGCPTPRLPFTPRLAVLRESYLSAPGYEIIYGAASALRSAFVMSSSTIPPLGAILDSVVSGELDTLFRDRLDQR
jgi:hypothetical protein